MNTTSQFRKNVSKRNAQVVKLWKQVYKGVPNTKTECLNIVSHHTGYTAMQVRNILNKNNAL